MNYDENANFWDRTEKNIQSDFLCRPYVFNMIGDVKGKYLIDVGCGEGYVSRNMAKFGARVVGVEKEASMVELAVNREKKDNFGINYYQGDTRDLKNFYDKFDIALSVLVYGHLDSNDMGIAVKETYRSLKDEGTFILAVPHPFKYIFKPSKTVWIEFDDSNSDYWKEKNNIRLRTGDGRSFDIEAYNHTVGDYMNALLKNGFCIQEICEPKATKKDLETFPEMWGEEDRIPFYLIIKAKKIR